jgi:hypothetical protein
MVKIAVRFLRITPMPQRAGSSDERMVSRVTFGIDLDGRYMGTHYADLKHMRAPRAAGPAPLAADAIEVGPPKKAWSSDDYKGPWAQQAFAEAVRAYFVGLVAPTERASRRRPRRRS